ncbi:MAG: hypothetical protein NC391_11110, partial [Alistipes timonensis]|nr:hypothetical protein [Alistipes timonensis]
KDYQRLNDRLAMSINGNKITAPVGAHEPYRVLGVAVRADGWNVNYICSNAHGKTNKWAMYKPIRHDYPGELTPEHRRSVLYGLVRPEIAPLYYTEDSDWTYEPPNRSTDWMRLLDFDGYYHGAECGISIINWPSELVVDQECAIPRPKGVEANGNIPAEHLMAMRNSNDTGWISMYWGVGYRYSSKTQWSCKTVDTASATEFTLRPDTLPDFESRQYARDFKLELCAFLSAVRIADWTEDSGTARIIPLPKAKSEYRFRDYTGKLKMRHTPRYVALCGIQGASASMHTLGAQGMAAVYTKSQVSLGTAPVETYVALRLNPYAPSANAGSSGQFRIVYPRMSVDSKGGLVWDWNSNAPIETNLGGIVKRVTVGGVEYQLHKVTLPARSAAQESLKNFSGGGKLEIWFRVYERVEQDDGSYKWYEITDISDRPIWCYDNA